MIEAVESNDESCWSNDLFVWENRSVPFVQQLRPLGRKECERAQMRGGVC